MPRYNIPDGKGSSVHVQAASPEQAREFFEQGLYGDAAKDDPGAFDQANATVTEVLAWVDEDPSGERAREAFASEEAGKARKSLLSPLGAMVKGLDGLLAASAADEADAVVA